MMQHTRNRINRRGVMLFFMISPLLVLIFVLNYLPLRGWIYAFYDYKPGLRLDECEFVGFKHFYTMLINPYSRAEVMRVLRNTFAMSFLGILSSPLPMIFAILLGEIRSSRYRKVIQTITTLPNFISWVLVYAIAFAMFSVGDGFVNRVLVQIGILDDAVNLLASDRYVWLKMLAWSTWKSLGWNAIMYIAALAGIDQEQYEAAAVDGANRFQRIWHVTVPGLLPTFFVLLILSIANFINNGMEQYYVFQNSMTKSYVEVLDLYVYNLGLAGRQYSFSTAVGMLKSIVSVFLLFFANSLSKLFRGETIV